MNKRKIKKKPSWFSLGFPLLWFCMFSLAVIGLMEDKELDYVLIGVCGAIALISILVLIAKLRKILSKTSDWEFSAYENNIISSLESQGYSEKKAKELLLRYIDDMEKTDEGLFLESYEWAHHLRQADEEGMTRQRWNDYVVSLKGRLSSEIKHRISDMDREKANYNARIEKLLLENEGKEVKPPWLLDKLVDAWGLVVVTIFILCFVIFEMLPSHVLLYLDEHFTIVIVAVLVIIFLTSSLHYPYVNWYEKKYDKYHENLRKVKELREKMWELDAELWESVKGEEEE